MRNTYSISMHSPVWYGSIWKSSLKWKRCIYYHRCDVGRFSPILYFHNLLRLTAMFLQNLYLSWHPKWWWDIESPLSMLIIDLDGENWGQDRWYSHHTHTHTHTHTLDWFFIHSLPKWSEFEFSYFSDGLFQQKV